MKHRASSEKKVHPPLHVVPSLVPLTCPSCAAPVPLCDADTTPCPSCGVTVQLPQDYRLMREAARARASAEAQLAALYVRLGAPPGHFLSFYGGGIGLLLRAGYALYRGLTWLLTPLWYLGRALLELVELVRGGELLGLVVKGVALVLGLGLLVACMLGVEELREYGRMNFGRDLLDLYSTELVLGGLGLAAILVTSVPVHVLTFMSAFNGAREKARTSLAARAPLRPGGPMGCRMCGAALEVAQGELGVRCAYCQSDNLVAVPLRAATDARDTAAGEFQRVQEAASYLDEVRSRAWAELWDKGRWSLLVPVVLAALGFSGPYLLPMLFRGGWSAAVSGPRQLFSENCPVYDDDCFAPDSGHLVFALRKGEVAELVEVTPSREPLPPTEKGLCVRPHSLSRCLVPLAPEEGFPRTARFEALHSGWYTVRFAGRVRDWRLSVTAR